MKKAKLFKPDQKDLERVANIIAENLSSDKKVIAGNTKIQGEKTSAKDWLDMDLKSQSGSIWKDDPVKSRKENKYKVQHHSAIILNPDPVRYGNVIIQNNPEIIE